MRSLEVGHTLKSLPLMPVGGRGSPVRTCRVTVSTQTTPRGGGGRAVSTQTSPRGSSPPTPPPARRTATMAPASALSGAAASPVAPVDPPPWATPGCETSSSAPLRSPLCLCPGRRPPLRRTVLGAGGSFVPFRKLPTHSACAQSWQLGYSCQLCAHLPGACAAHEERGQSR